MVFTRLMWMGLHQTLMDPLALESLLEIVKVIQLLPSANPFQSHFSAELVEILALEQGILLAQDMQLTCVMFECDASNVINAVNDSAIGTPFGHIIQDIIQAQASFSFCSFRHLNRAFNYAAHELAAFASRNGSFQLWKGVTPPFLVSVVNANLLLYLSCSAGSSLV